MESAIEIGSLWRRDGKDFAVIHVGQEMKDADAANWSPAVGYQAVSGDDNTVRIRTESDFRAKYSPAA